MLSPQPRVATLVLCTSSGDVLGALPPFQVDLPWWQDAEGLVFGARERYGVDLTILRLLEAGPASPPGGRLSYLAEAEEGTAAGLPLLEWDGTIDDHPLRMTYARPGGPAHDLAWARAALARLRMSADGAARQIRTWNQCSAHTERNRRSPIAGSLPFSLREKVQTSRNSRRGAATSR